MIIKAIVEGKGEMEAVPVLLRRLVRRFDLRGDVKIVKPNRVSRGRLVQKEGLEEAIQKARKDRPDAILIVFDSDKDCPAELGQKILEWAGQIAGDIPCQVVMPHREFEAWFLAHIESLQGKRGIRLDATSPQDPERRRGAKEQLEGKMEADKVYDPVKDQPALSEMFCMDEAYAKCRSFRKMVSAFRALVLANGYDVPPWPGVYTEV